MISKMVRSSTNFARRGHDLTNSSTMQKDWPELSSLGNTAITRRDGRRHIGDLHILGASLEEGS